MSEILLKKDAIALIVIISFCLIKLFIDFFVKTTASAFSVSYLHPQPNIVISRKRAGFYLKIFNNFLTIVVLAFAVVYLFVFEPGATTYEIKTALLVAVDTPAVRPAVIAPIAEVVPVEFINTKPVAAIKLIKQTLITKPKKVVIKQTAPVTLTIVRDAKKLNDKELASEEMDSILNMVNGTRKEFGIESRCVQVIKTRGSNVKNAFDLARFFKKNGYVIAGRELRSDVVKGVKIIVSGFIIKVSVGTFDVKENAETTSK